MLQAVENILAMEDIFVPLTKIIIKIGEEG